MVRIRRPLPGRAHRDHGLGVAGVAPVAGERERQVRVSHHGARGSRTDFLNAQGDAYADLAEVLLLGGKRVDAAAALEQALERYQRKENLVSAERTRARLDELAGLRADA